MSSRPPLVFKSATEDFEFEQIHRLNYHTFVEEIPQHHASPTQRLVDKFHSENTYLISLCGNKLVGMLAVRGNRPFSLDQKLPNLDSYLPPGRKICEIRLLAVEKKRSEEHTSELQSPCNLVCRLLLEKKKKRPKISTKAPDPPSTLLHLDISVVSCV